MVTQQYLPGRAADWTLIPEHMREGVDNWILHGLPYCGDFLAAVVCNDLREAVERADDVNRGRLADYVRFFYNYAPSGCWGSKERFDRWVRHGGLLGLTSLDDEHERRAADECAQEDSDERGC